MLVFKRFLYILITYSFLFISFTYSQSVGTVAKKTGGVGLAIQGVKTGKEGLRQLTKYGQELATQQDNQTKQTSEQQDIQTNEISQQSIKQNIQTKQQTQQNSNNNILDNLASSMQDSTDKLKTGIDKSTKPLQNTISDIGNLFSKIKGSVSSDDNSKEQTETVSNNDNNNNRDNNGSGDNGDDTKEMTDDLPPTTKQIEKFQKQFKNDGLKSLEKSKNTIQHRLDEHLQKLKDINSNNGYSSSVEREIKNFKREIKAIDQVIEQNK